MVSNRHWVGWVLIAALAAGLAGCDSEPKSGNYCPVKPVEGGHGIYSNCIFVNFDKQELKIYHTDQEIVKVEVVAYPRNWEITAVAPKTGPWAGGLFNIYFDRDDPSMFDFKSLHRDETTRYQLKKD